MEYRVVKYNPIYDRLDWIEYKVEQRTDENSKWEIAKDTDFYTEDYLSFIDKQKAIDICTRLRLEEDNRNTFEVIF